MDILQAAVIEVQGMEALGTAILLMVIVGLLWLAGALAAWKPIDE